MSKLIGVAAAAMAALLLAAPASADYKSEYKAYAAAIDISDLAAAVRHGEAAWRAAETELGDNATTAILAYNLAILVADFQPAKAAEAYARALAIAEAGIGALSAAELRVRLAEANVLASGDKPRKEQKELLETLESALEALPALASESPEAHARGWRTVAMLRMRAGQTSRSRQAADLAIESAGLLGPIDSRLLAESLVVGAIARLSSTNRDDVDVVEAIALLDRSFPLFPPQKDIHSFDQLLAQAMAWRLSVNPIADTKDSLRFTTGTRLVSPRDMKNTFERANIPRLPQDMFRWQPSTNAGCNDDIKWKEQPDPVFPMEAINRGFIGSIIVGYDLNATGVERVVMLSDFPAAGFGEAAAKALKKWTLAAPPSPACSKNQITYFTFTLIY